MSDKLKFKKIRNEKREKQAVEMASKRNLLKKQKMKNLKKKRKKKSPLKKLKMKKKKNLQWLKQENK